MQRTFEPTRGWMHVVGNGSYTSYFGIVVSDNPVVLVTDCQVVNWERSTVHS